ncbi:hypothetical protein [Clostridium sp. DJ247]|uniref:hypothetical protein n=1 Tax=Clostridium sp. DJ247 TaxID=2726188 RepID=UPI001F4CE7AC|nr:hypothetical protein [Clostridium sp. DJ247]
MELCLNRGSCDTGSCNGCMLELSAAQNNYYPLSRYGINFAASPRLCDGIVKFDL